jgi:hypothetical protein
VVSELYSDYHLLGDDNHHSHRRGNLKSYELYFACKMRREGMPAGNVHLHYPITIVPRDSEYLNINCTNQRNYVGNTFHIKCIMISTEICIYE